MSRRALLVAGASVILAGCQRGPDDAPAPVVGRRTPDFSLTTLEGGRLSPGDFAGRPLILNFFATWCIPCRQELPAFQSLAERYRDRGLSFLLIDLQEDPEDVATFLDELRVTLPAVVDETGDVTKAYRVRGLPSTFFVDRAGVIRAVQLGALDEHLLEGGIQKIV